MSKTNALRIQSRRAMKAKKKAANDHAKGKVFHGPSPRKLKIRA